MNQTGWIIFYILLAFSAYGVFYIWYYSTGTIPAKVYQTLPHIVGLYVGYLVLGWFFPSPPPSLIPGMTGGRRRHR